MKANPTTQQGSFGIPKAMQDNINARENLKMEEAKKEPAPPSTQQKPTESGPTTMTVDDIAAAEKRLSDQEILKEKVRLKLAIENIEERLGIVVGEQDLIDSVRKGRVTKNPVTIIKDKLSVGFQTLTGEDVQAIEDHMYEVRTTGKATSSAIENEQVFWNLAYGLSSYQGKDTSAVKDKAKIKEQITKLGSNVITRLNQAYKDFNNLVNLKMEDPDFIKK